MSYREPESMDECVYFTQRSLEGDKGRITAWVFRGDCPKCGKSKMGKPKDSSGKVKIRAKEYVCPGCGYSAQKDEYEDSLVAYAKYDCPSCGESGEAETPFRRKSVKGVKTLRFQCGQCQASLDVTKKMK